ncbi:hypothetical protein [Halosegnis sp.]|uniref:DUF7553 family protein n=1 Tax=Halosegnis sp. TaxID=2864959 RepID=UPI0035D418CB
MSRDHLRQAATALDRAAENLSDAERARELAETLRSLAERERGPDHGRLARIERALAELGEDVDGAATEAIAETTEHVQAYRETVEGV